MSINDLPMQMDWLREIGIFNELNDVELSDLGLLVQTQRVPRGRHVFYEGDERTAVFFVRSGGVKVTKVDEEGREQIVSFLQAGDMFPHVGFFDDSPYPGTAQALDDSVLASVAIRDFERLLARQPKIAFKVMRVLGRKILELQQKLQDVTLQNASERVVHTLVHLALSYGEAKGDGRTLSFRVTNRELASMIGTTRETVNRVLNDLRRQGKIDFDAEGIWLSAELLTSVAE